MRRLFTVCFLAAAALAESPEELAGAIADPDPEVRLAAVRKLQALGAGAAPAVEALIDAAYDETLKIRTAAVRALRGIGPAARAAVHPLEQLREGYAPFDRKIALALDAIGTAGVPRSDLAGLGTEALLEALRSEDGRVRGEAAFYLRSKARLDKSLATPLVEALAHRRQYARMQAHRALLMIQDKAMVDVFLKELKSPDVRRRRLGARGLGRWRTPEEIAGLIAALDDRDPLVRRAAVGSIGYLREYGAAAGPRLLELMKNEPRLRGLVMPTLLSLHVDGVVPVMAGYLDADDVVLRRDAANCLSFTPDKTALVAALRPLIRACFDADWQVRSSATRALGSMEAKAAAAAPYLAELADASPMASGSAKPALARIGVGAPLPPVPSADQTDVLIAQLSDPDPETAGRAAFQLGRLAPQSGPALRALRAALERDECYVRRHAVLALERVGDPALPLLVDALRNGEAPTRRMAMEVLARLVPLSKNAPREAIREALADTDEGVRMYAAQVIGNIGIVDAVPDLIRLVAKDDAATGPAIYSLGRLGSKAAAAVPLLVGKLADWEDQGTASSIIFALGEMGAAAEPAVPAIVDAALWGRGLEDAVVRALGALGVYGQAGLVEIIRRVPGHTRARAIGIVLEKNLTPPGLRDALEEGRNDPIARNAVLRALQETAESDTDQVETLLAAIREEKASRYQRSSIPYSLAKVASPEQLMQHLAHKDERVRWCVFRALSLMDGKVFTPARKRALEPLILEAMQEPSPERWAAAALTQHVPPTKISEALFGVLATVQLPEQALAAIGKLPHAASLAVDALANEDPDVQKGALAVLRHMGAGAAPQIERITAAMAKDPDNLGLYRGALLSIGVPALPALLEELKKASTRERGYLFEGIAKLGDSALPALEKAFADGDAVLRREIVFVLWRFRGKALPVLLRAARDEDARVRAAALSQLGRLPDHADKTVPVLVRALPAKEAARSLRGLGAKALEGLRAAVADDDPAVRAAAVGAVGGLGKAALPLVTAGLRDKDERVISAAIRTAGELGEVAAPLVPQLHEALRKGSQIQKRAASTALPRLGPGAKVAIPDIVELFVIGDSSDRSAASSGLVLFEADAVPHLVTLMGHKDKRVAGAAVRALLKIGEPSIDAAVECFRKGPEAVREQAGTLLVSLRAAVALAGLLKDDSRDIRVAAAWRLGQMKRRAIPAIDALIAALDDRETFVVSQAAWALGEIGPAAKTALPRLKEMLKNGALESVARDAIKRIER